MQSESAQQDQRSLTVRTLVFLPWESLSFFILSWQCRCRYLYWSDKYLPKVVDHRLHWGDRCNGFIVVDLWDIMVFAVDWSRSLGFWSVLRNYAALQFQFHFQMDSRTHPSASLHSSWSLLLYSSSLLMVVSIENHWLCMFVLETTFIKKCSRRGWKEVVYVFYPLARKAVDCNCCVVWDRWFTVLPLPSNRMGFWTL